MRHTRFTVHGRPFLSLGAQAHNSSTYHLDDLARAYAAVHALGGNTIAIPVAWDRFEAAEGQFDEAYVRDLILRTRAEGLHLVLTWFGTWKNGTMEYVPGWVKGDPTRFPRVVCADGSVTAVLSSHYAATREADRRAYCALMQVIREADAGEQTVIAVQVQNEAGILSGTRRDFGPAGQADFASAVPSVLVEYARAHPATALGREWTAAGARETGTWSEVFGRYGAEAVTAWSIATYVEAIAAAGKDVYDLFTYTNAWSDGSPGWRYGWWTAGLDYPAGGPAVRNLDIWSVAAPSLDAICPDNYSPVEAAHAAAADAYVREGYPLYVPESAAGNLNATWMFHALGNRDAIGYHVFAAESVVDDAGSLVESAQAMGRSMRMAVAVVPLLAEYAGTGRTYALLQHAGAEEAVVDVEGWKCRVGFGAALDGWMSRDYRHRPPADVRAGLTDTAAEKGRGLLFQVDTNEFYLVGHYVRVMFAPEDPMDGCIPILTANPGMAVTNRGYLALTEGHFDDQGVYVIDRRRSGDEARHGVWADADCGVIHVVLDPA